MASGDQQVRSVGPGIAERDASVTEKEKREVASETDPKMFVCQAFFCQTYDLRKTGSRYDLGFLSRQEIRDCCAHIRSETVVTTLEQVIAPDQSSQDTILRSAGRRRALCLYNNWFSGAVKVDGRGSPDVEFLMLRCRPIYLPREFTSEYIAVYIPPDAIF